MKRPVIPIVIAIVLALAAGAAVYFYARTAENRALQAQQPVAVLTSASVIPMGTSLAQAQADGLIATTQVPEQLRPADAIDSVSAANRDLVALADIPAGQLLLAPAFGAAPTQVAALRVPDGLMAVTVLLEDPGKVGSFLRPGSQVAVFDTVARPGTEVGMPMAFSTRPLIDRVEVLAVGAVTEEQEATATAEDWTARLVTLAVDQAQAERLVHGTHTGVLTLALLGEDTTLTPSLGVSDADLFSAGGAS